MLSSSSSRRKSFMSDLSPYDSSLVSLCFTLVTSFLSYSLSSNRYEDYLDSHISKTDLFYLEDIDMARQLVELGYRGNGEILRREEFEDRKRAQAALRMQKTNQKPKQLASEGKNLEGFPVLQACRWQIFHDQNQITLFHSLARI